ncbi:hypothetical protein CIT25_28995 [Mesorhizobium mediterraneum]|uniref:Uncharacterized protein n=1 Tax=Mesorhizobium mediterraneum TaxID=43617 RepID=A0AB36R2H3_9HYPH|nr:hypothetical protein CIT25_28995 [Mesorhizobium mediterraneum]
MWRLCNKCDLDGNVSAIDPPEKAPLYRTGPKIEIDFSENTMRKLNASERTLYVRMERASL